MLKTVTMATAMVEDSSFEEDQLASMTTEDIVRASRLLDTEIRILKVPIQSRSLSFSFYICALIIFPFVGEEEDESPFSSSPTRIHGTGSVGIKSEIDKDALDMGFNDIFGDLQSLAAEFEIPDQRKRRKSDASSRFASRKAPKPNQEIQHAFDEKPVMVKTSFNNADHYYSSIESIVDALQAIPGMDDVLFLDASKLLEDEKNAQMFVAMDVTQRRKWLLRRLRR